MICFAFLVVVLAHTTKHAAAETCQKLKENSPTLLNYKCSGTEFAPKQCDPHSCVCVDVKTGDVIPRYKGNDPQTMKAMTCECASKLHYYNSGNIAMSCDSLGNFNPTCTNFHDTQNQRCDGLYFKRVRCDSWGCTCYDWLTGTPLKYKETDATNEVLMSCDCAIDKFHNQKKISGPCAANGNYPDDDTQCLRIRKKKMATNDLANLPNCTKNGDFPRVMCDGTWCQCIHPKTGVILQGQAGLHILRQNPDSATMDCACATDKILYELHKLPHRVICLPNGNYSSCLTLPLQPHDPKQNAIRCMLDKTFHAVQCRNNWCWCVNEFGHRILGYVIRLANTIGMNCRCAVDKDKHFRLSLKFTHFCKSNGNYLDADRPS